MIAGAAACGRDRAYRRWALSLFCRGVTSRNLSIMLLLLLLQDTEEDACSGHCRGHRDRLVLAGAALVLAVLAVGCTL